MSSGISVSRVEYFVTLDHFNDFYQVINGAKMVLLIIKFNFSILFCFYTCFIIDLNSIMN